MQEIPNAFANAFAHVAHELLHDDLNPILNALKKDRPATLKKVAKNLAQFNTGAERQSRPLVRRDWEELLEQNMQLQYPPTSNQESTPPSTHYGSMPPNKHTCPDSGSFLTIQQILPQQDKQQQPMNVEQVQNPVLFESPKNCFEEDECLVEQVFAEYSGNNHVSLAPLYQRCHFN